LEGFQAMSVCPSGQSNMNMKDWYGLLLEWPWQRKTQKVLGQKPVPEPLWPRIDRDRNQSSCAKGRPMPNRLSHGRAI